MDERNFTYMFYGFAAAWGILAVYVLNRSLAVTAPLLSRARQQAVFGPRASLLIEWKESRFFNGST